MEIIPAGAGAAITTSFGDIVAANSVAIIAVLGVAIAVVFVMRWFRKSTNKLKG